MRVTSTAPSPRARSRSATRARRWLTLARGEGFGEIALIEDVPRTATVIATRDTEVYCLEKGPFILALTGHPAARSTVSDVVSSRRDELRAVEREPRGADGDVRGVEDLS